MRQVLIISAAACVLVATGFSLLSAQQAAEPRDAAGPAWEYRLVSFADLTAGAEGDEAEIQAVEAKFNELGREGWELSENLFRAVVFKRARRAVGDADVQVRPVQ